MEIFILWTRRQTQPLSPASMEILSWILIAISCSYMPLIWLIQLKQYDQVLLNKMENTVEVLDSYLSPSSLAFILYHRSLLFPAIIKH